MSADLPEDTIIESIKVVEKAPSTSSSSSKCKHEKGSDIVDSICKMHTSRMQVELAKCKLELLQKKRPRRDKEPRIFIKLSRIRQKRVTTLSLSLSLSLCLSVCHVCLSVCPSLSVWLYVSVSLQFCSTQVGVTINWIHTLLLSLHSLLYHNIPFQMVLVCEPKYPKNLGYSTYVYK